MEIEQHTGQRGGVEQIDQRKAACGEHALGATQCQPVDRERAQREQCRLDQQQQLRVGPEPIERRQQEIDQLDMAGQTAEAAVGAGVDQRLAARRRGDRLRHVAQVEHPGVVAAIARDAQAAAEQRRDAHAEPEKPARAWMVMIHRAHYLEALASLARPAGSPAQWSRRSGRRSVVTV